MADAFPTALQRTSDERWVSLEVVARVHGRLVARIAEDPRRAAVVCWGAEEAYGAHLERLLHAPPPAPGRGVHLTWPDDLLHDLDARIVGYTAPRSGGGRTFPLGDYVDPATRAKIAPMATRRHHLRVARNVATAIAAVHHAGHGRVRGRQFRVDERAGIVVVHADSLIAEAAPSVILDDERRLGALVVRLVGGRPWAAGGGIAQLLARAEDPRRAAPPASEWFHALREAERELPAEPVSVGPATETRVATSTDLATALARSRGPAGHDGRGGAAGPGGAQPAVPPRASHEPGPPARAPIRITVPEVLPEPAGGRPSLERPITLPASAPIDLAAPASFGSATQTTPPPVTAPPVAAGRTATAAPAEPTRMAFVVAAALLAGGVASVAPFAAFVAAATGVCMAAALRVGRRRSTLGAHQTVAITVTRLVPFATGGLAFAAFILLDLLLVLGLVMAVAERVFSYGPGFTLGWVFDLPEVPALVRGFAFVIGGALGASLGGTVHDRLATTARQRSIAAPAVALALVLLVLVADAGVVWWPLPLVG